MLFWLLLSISAYFSVLVLLCFGFELGLLVCRLIVLIFVAIGDLDVVLHLVVYCLHALGVAGGVVVCCVFFVFVFAGC